MRRFFADTFYWLALANPSDQWHNRVIQIASALGVFSLVTTDEVLTEFLTGMAALGEHRRREAIETVRDILTDPLVTVCIQTHQTFLEGMALYERRADKQYSLPDCVSMNTMREMGLTEILTNDHHFTQEGFTVLIPK